MRSVAKGFPRRLAQTHRAKHELQAAWETLGALVETNYHDSYTGRADAFDALAASGSSGSQMSAEEALSELRGCSGQQLDSVFRAADN